MFSTFIHNLTYITKWLALATMAFMMVFTAIGVISRTFFTPILGDVELVQLAMVILIMCGLAYTENVNGHISIGLVVDKFPKKIQLGLDILGRTLNVIATFIIGFVFIEVGINHKVDMHLSTDLLSIPFYPFDFLIAIGFIFWGLEALLKLISSVSKFITN